MMGFHSHLVGSVAGAEGFAAPLLAAESRDALLPCFNPAPKRLCSLLAADMGSLPCLMAPAQQSSLFQIRHILPCTGNMSYLLWSGVRTFTYQTSECHELLRQKCSVLLRNSASPDFLGLPSADGCVAELLASAPAALCSPVPDLASVTTRGGVAGLGIAEKNKCPASRWPWSTSTGASGLA